MNEQKNSEEEIWLQLAELFFLDTEPTDEDFKRIAQQLVAAGWTVQSTYVFITKFIAPKYGANLGFLIYPVIGEWAGFDRAELVKEVNRRIALRKKYPDWYFLISDWWMKRLLRSLDFAKLEKAMNSLAQ